MSVRYPIRILKYALLLLAYKSLTGQAPLYLAELLEPKILSHHNLRSNDILNTLAIKDSKSCHSVLQDVFTPCYKMFLLHDIRCFYSVL